MKKFVSLFCAAALLCCAAAAGFAQAAPRGSGPVKPEQVLSTSELSSGGDLSSTLIKTASERIYAIEDKELATIPLMLDNGSVCWVKDIPGLPAGEYKDLAIKALQRQIDNSWLSYETFQMQLMGNANVTVIEPQEAETRRLAALLTGAESTKRLLLTGAAEFKSLRDEVSRHYADPETFLGRLYESAIDSATIVRICFNIDTLLKFSRNPGSRIDEWNTQEIINFARKYAHLKMFDDTSVLRRIADLGIRDPQVLERIDPEFRIRGSKRFADTYMTTEAALAKLEEIKGDLWYRQLSNLRGGDGISDISRSDITAFDNQFGKDLQRLGIADSRRFIEQMAADGSGWGAVARTLCNLDIFRAGGAVSPTEQDIRSFAVALKDEQYSGMTFSIEYIRKTGSLHANFLSTFNRAKSSLSAANTAVTVIREKEFYDKELTSTVIPDTVTTIENQAFAFNRLTSVVIPKSVTYIGWNAFSFNSLTSIVIPDGVYIDLMAFGNNKLTSITIGKDVRIHNTAFDNGFTEFYNKEGKKAGVYTYNDRKWTFRQK